MLQNTSRAKSPDVSDMEPGSQPMVTHPSPHFFGNRSSPFQSCNHNSQRLVHLDESRNPPNIVPAVPEVTYPSSHSLGSGSHSSFQSSNYNNQGLLQHYFNNCMNGRYIAPGLADKLVVHITKNSLPLPNIRVPLILGIWGGKGQGKSFMCKLIMTKMGIEPITINGRELERLNSGEHAKLIKQRYLQAADIIKSGKLCCLFIDNLDAAARRTCSTTPYIVLHQVIIPTLMSIAENPRNVKLAGIYNTQGNPRVPIIVTGNDFSMLPAPHNRGCMVKFCWAPTYTDLICVCLGIFGIDNVDEEDMIKLVNTFPNKSIDFFVSTRARMFDEEVDNMLHNYQYEDIRSMLSNPDEGPSTLKEPPITIEKILRYGKMVHRDEEIVERVSEWYI